MIYQLSVNYFPMQQSWRPSTHIIATRTMSIQPIFREVNARAAVLALDSYHLLFSVSLWVVSEALEGGSLFEVIGKEVPEELWIW